MRIFEMLQLEVFRGSKLLTDGIGLDHEVESVMVLEALDVENWSRKNQLILTSFYAFQKMPQSEIDHFFEKLEEIGVSGIVIKMDRLITKIPYWFSELCEAHELPLVKITREVTYEEILLAIYQPLLNHQSLVLKTYYDVRQKLSRFTRNYSTFEKIMKASFLMLRKPCLLIIPEENIRIALGGVPKDWVIVREEQLNNSEFAKGRYTVLTLYDHQTARETSAIETTIINRFVSECTLTIFDEDAEIKETDMMIIENIIDVLQEKLQLEYVLKRDRGMRLNNLANAILQNTPQNTKELDSLLNEAGLDHYSYYQGLAFSTASLEDQLIKRQVRKKLRALREHVLYFEHHNYLILLYNLEKKDSQISKERLKQLVAGYQSDYPDLIFSISRVKEKENLKEVLAECLEAIEFDQKFYIGQVVSIMDLGIFRFFAKEENWQAAEQLIPEALRDMEQVHYDWFETLLQFFQNKRNYTQTADALFLHPKTVRYRLGKIQEKLGIDLENPIQSLNFEVGTYLLAWKKRGKRHGTNDPIN